MICTKCGAEIKDDSKFCVHCGNKVETAAASVTAVKAEAPVPKRICPGCGAEITSNSKFCTKCGTKIPDAAPQPVQTEAEQTAVPKTVAPRTQAGTVQQPVTPQPQPRPVQQPVNNAAADNKGGKKSKKDKKKSSKGILIFFIILILLIVCVAAGAGFYYIGIKGEDPKSVIANIIGKDSDEEDDETEGSKAETEEIAEKGDVTLLEPAQELAEKAKSEYDAGNYTEGAIPNCIDAINEYMSVAEENNLKEEAQEGIDEVYPIYLDALMKYCDSIVAQGAYAAGFTQVSDMIADMAELTDTLEEKGYTVDSASLYTYKDNVVSEYRDIYINSINKITEYENWSRDEAWTLAEQAYSIKENGKPLLFDDEELDDPLRLRYVYCLAWITRKRCETGLADGSMSYLDAVNNMVAILDETDYNILLLQDIVTYGNNAGLDVNKYAQAYNAIVDEIKSEQNLTIRTDIGVNSASSVDAGHFWYFNDLDGDAEYKVDMHNGTTAATRDWIRTNIPGMLE